jgi:hypothetical protein
MLKSTIIQVTLTFTTIFAFLGSYLYNLTTDHIDQYLSIIAVLLLDGFFGIISGIKREGFKTHKALTVLKNIVAWLFILTGILTIEYAFPGTDWLSETILAPFLIFQLVSALKNASMAGFIRNELLNEILDRIDKHKGTRKTKSK